MYDSNQSIKYGKKLMGLGYKYSMEKRWSIGYRDCSSFVYDCLINGGCRKISYIPSTETLHQYLENNQFKLISYNQSWDMKKGDVIIFGKKGVSGGSGGHTGICIDNNYVMHCNYSSNGITIDHETTMPYNMNFYVYRFNVSQLVKNNIELSILINEIKRGKYGNGETRKQNLYKNVQGCVNDLINNKKHKYNKDIELISKMVMNGEFGNGSNRVDNIYNYVQSQVNKSIN